MCIFKNLKIWIIVALVIAVAGAVMIAIFGLNQTPDYKAAYEVKVVVDQNVGGASEKVDSAAKGYFNEIGYNSSDYATEVSEDGTTYIYKFHKAGNVIESVLKTNVETALVGIESKVSSVEYKATAVSYDNLLKTILACGLGLLVAFIISFFVVKAASALTVVCNAVISAVIYVMIVAITRIPALPDIAVGAAIAMILSVVMTFVIICRYKEQLRLDDKADITAIAEKGLESEKIRLCFLAGAGVLAAIVLSVTGNLYLLFTGLKVLVATCSAFIVSCVATPTLWKLFKNKKRA